MLDEKTMTVQIVTLVELKKLLNELEEELKKMSLWQGLAGRPPESAFLSMTPFFMDTMEFHQWLEYVFIPRLNALESQELSNLKVIVAPYAIEVYRGQWTRYAALIRLLKKIDAFFF